MLTYRFKKPNVTADDKPPLLLLLHGIGADENDLFGLAPFMDERFFIASARAPHQLPWGGFAWFELGINGAEISYDIKQVETSRQMIVDLTEDIVLEHDLDPQRIFLCGFSQGAIMSLSAALRNPEKFAGIVAMSGRAMPEMIPESNDFERLRDFPIFVSHGTLDPVLPIENGRATREILSRLPVDLKYEEYEMAHEISQNSLQDVADWLRAALDKKN